MILDHDSDLNQLILIMLILTGLRRQLFDRLSAQKSLFTMVALGSILLDRLSAKHAQMKIPFNKVRGLRQKGTLGPLAIVHVVIRVRQSGHCFVWFQFWKTSSLLF